MKTAFANISGGLVFAGETYGEMNFSKVDLRQYGGYLQQIGADVLGLTEVHLEDEDGSSHMADCLTQQLGLPYKSVRYAHESHLDTSKQMGTAILSRYPIVRDETFVLESPKLEVDRPNGDHWVMYDKTAQRVTLQTEHGQVDAVNLSYFPFHHFNRRMDEPAFAGLRSQLVDILVADGNPTIVLGDFNNKFVPFGKAFPELFTHGFAEAIITPTTVAGFSDQQLDHILYPQEFFEASDGFAIDIRSDHLAVGATLRYLC